LVVAFLEAQQRPIFLFLSQVFKNQVLGCVETMAEPLNISMIERQLCVERLEAPGKLAWLEKSYRDPLAFKL
jgi:hypothetical protein